MIRGSMWDRPVKPTLSNEDMNREEPWAASDSTCPYGRCVFLPTINIHFVRRINLKSMMGAFQSIVNSSVSDDLKAAQVAAVSIVSIIASVFAILKIGGPGLATLQGSEAFKATLLLIFANFITRAIASAQ